MKKVIFSIAAMLCIALVSLTTSCKKDELTTASTDQITAEDLTAINDLSEQIDADVDTKITNFTGEIDDRTDCPSVSSTQPLGTWPNTIVLDYSDGGCEKNGVTYKGKITIVQTGPIRETGNSRTITFDNFFVENVQFTGTKLVKNEGPNANGQITLSVEANETILFPDGTQSTYNAVRTRTLIEGGATETRIDDVWSITGGANGTNRNGIAYTTTITEPLIKRPICRWISQGVLTFTTATKTRSLDFGDGTCDRDATLTLADGTVKEIKIRRIWWK